MKRVTGMVWQENPGAIFSLVDSFYQNVPSPATARMSLIRHIYMRKRREIKRHKVRRQFLSYLAQGVNGRSSSASPASGPPPPLPPPPKQTQQQIMTAPLANSSNNIYKNTSGVALYANRHVFHIRHWCWLGEGIQ